MIFNTLRPEQNSQHFVTTSKLQFFGCKNVVLWLKFPWTYHSQSISQRDPRMVTLSGEITTGSVSMSACRVVSRNVSDACQIVSDVIMWVEKWIIKTIQLHKNSFLWNDDKGHPPHSSTKKHCRQKCVGNLTIIGSDNGLSPGRRQAIIWTNAEILFFKNRFSDILIKILTFSLKKNAFENIVCKMAVIYLGLNDHLSRPQRVNDYFLTQLLVGQQLCCWPTKSYIRESVSLHEFQQSILSIMPGIFLLVCTWLNCPPYFENAHP